MTLDYSAEIEKKLAHKIRECLHEKYRLTSSPVKRVGQATGLPIDTIKRWYKGQNLPKIGHLLILARVYPEIMSCLLYESGYEDLIPFVQPFNPSLTSEKSSDNFEQKPEKNVPINVPIKSFPSDFNHRQRWFLVQLQEGMHSTAAKISARWSVNIKTARRDIADLKERGLIKFQGPRKTGWYVMAE